MRTILTFIIIATLIHAWSPAAVPQNGRARVGREAKLRDFEAFVRRQMKKEKIPGLTIGFSRGDERWVEGFGYADLENFAAFERHARETFRGAEVFPDLLEQLRQYQQQTSDRRDWPAGYRASRLMADLYPQSDVANIYLAVNALTLGRRDEAAAALRRATEINGRGIASPAVLDAIAHSLARQKLPDVAVNWLRLGLEGGANSVLVVKVN